MESPTIDMTSQLFTDAKIECPKCRANLNMIPGLLVCEHCGFYHVKQKIGRIMVKRQSGKIINQLAY